MRRWAATARAGLWAVVLLCLVSQAAVAVRAQDAGFAARATVDAHASHIRDRWGGKLEVALSLSQGVPWRLYTLTAPDRVVLELKGVDWQGLDPSHLLRRGKVSSVAFGPAGPGWSRLVLTLRAPVKLVTSGLSVDPDTGHARLLARFVQTDAADFAAHAGAPADLPHVVGAPPAPVPPKRPLRILLDPGHGGVDPGAQRDGVQEKNLMLRLGFELRDVLRRSGAEVWMTRTDDSFVSLEARVAMAHKVDADVMISLHADALAPGEGHAEGITVHNLARDAMKRASSLLTERHARNDIIGGVDLSGSDDTVATVLLDLARQETQPRSEALAGQLVATLRAEGLPLNTKPRRTAGYAVLKAADVPAVLIETGFLSNTRDRQNLLDPGFRARLCGAIRDAIMQWSGQDATRARLRRQ